MKFMMVSDGYNNYGGPIGNSSGSTAGRRGPGTLRRHFMAMSDGIRVRHAHEGLLVDMHIDTTESTGRLRDAVEEKLPLGLSVSSLKLKGELLPSTMRLCDVEPSSLVRVKTKDQRPERYVILHNGSKPFLVEYFCRGLLQRVKIFQNLSEMWERYGWDGYAWHTEDYPLDEEDAGDVFPQVDLALKRRKIWHIESEEEVLDLGYGTRRWDFDSNPLHDLEVKDIFIGRSELEELTFHSWGYGSFDGNSILLKQKDQYIFVGKNILAFNSQHEIVKFASPVGNSTVPYSYAVDDHGRYFLFLEQVILDTVPLQSEEPHFGLARDFEPYWYLYQDFAYDKCEFQLRYGGTMITYRHPKMMLHRQPMRDGRPRYEKLVNGKVQRISSTEFEQLLTKWFKAHGISHMECHEIQFNGERKCWAFKHNMT